MASSLEFNKFAAAVLTAGIVASVAGILSHIVVHPKPLKENVYVVQGVEKPAAVADDKGAAGPEPIGPLLAAATPKAGEEVAKKCLQCHGFEKGGPNKVGPNLYGVVGAPVAKHEGFSYSAVLSAKGGAWDVEELNKFLYKPAGYVKGTKMSFAGLPKAEDRAAVIAYLSTLK